MDKIILDWSMSRILTRVKFVHISFLALIPVAVLVLALLPVFGFTPLFTGRKPVLEMMLGGGSLICLILGFGWPRLFGWYRTSNRAEQDVATGHIWRIGCFVYVVACGFLLVYAGSGWYVSIPLFILAGTALALTFPTEKRWAKWQRGKEPDIEPVD